jgi:hypothetical protein
MTSAAIRQHSRRRSTRSGPLIGFETEVAENRTLGLELGVFFGLTDASADTAVKGKLSYTY